MVLRSNRKASFSDQWDRKRPYNGGGKDSQPKRARSDRFGLSFTHHCHPAREKTYPYFPSRGEDNFKSIKPKYGTASRGTKYMGEEREPGEEEDQQSLLITGHQER